MFQRYNVPNAFDPARLYATDDQRLLSQLYATEQSKDSYLSVSMMSFQGLRVGDQNGTFPVVAPLIEGRYDPNILILGGRVQLEGSAVVLQRARNPYTDAAPDQDSRRATVSADWRSFLHVLQRHPAGALPARPGRPVQRREPVPDLERLHRDRQGAGHHRRQYGHLRRQPHHRPPAGHRRAGRQLAVLPPHRRPDRGGSSPWPNWPSRPGPSTIPTSPTRTARSSTSTRPTCSRPTSRRGSTTTRAGPGPMSAAG